LKITTSIPV